MDLSEQLQSWFDLFADDILDRVLALPVRKLSSSFSLSRT